MWSTLYNEAGHEPNAAPCIHITCTPIIPQVVTCCGQKQIARQPTTANRAASMPLEKTANHSRLTSRTWCLCHPQATSDAFVITLMFLGWLCTRLATLRKLRRARASKLGAHASRLRHDEDAGTRPVCLLLTVTVPLLTASDS